MKLNWKAVAGIAVSAFFIWWVLRGEDFSEIFTQIVTANPWYFIASIFVGTAGYFVRALRWRVLLLPLKANTRLRSRFSGVSIGFAANNIFPARLGEIARAFALSRSESLPVSGVFGSLVVERFLDSIVLVTMFLVPMAFRSFPGADGLLNGTVSSAMLGTTFGALTIFVTGLVVLLIFLKPLVQAARKVCLKIPGVAGSWIISALETIPRALQVLRHPVLLTKALLWSYAFWLWHGLSFWLGFKAFGIDLGFEAALFTMAVVGFAVAIPAAPGFFGTFQLGTDLSLSGVYGVPEATALAFSFGYHLGGFFPITIIGLYYASRLGFSLREVQRSKILIHGPIGESAEPCPPGVAGPEGGDLV
ncbi:MAG: lysylphosphatidylglycerol synthase transmembrane domain-containing protein [Gemmatimonadota bacterium]|nr:lysylphosphatidylglycerol synthase transmembrane domain-containing protein [Gemmatimonadota bacterium]